MQGWSQLDPEGYRASIERMPLQRVGDCEADIGRVVAFLASDDAAYLTAHTFMVDGGSGMFLSTWLLRLPLRVAVVAPAA